MPPQVKLNGAWLTKLEACVRRIVRGRVTAPGEKWLVFSAFQDALTMLGKALAANGVQAVHLRGNREVLLYQMVEKALIARTRKTLAQRHVLTQLEPPEQATPRYNLLFSRPLRSLQPPAHCNHHVAGHQQGAWRVQWRPGSARHADARQDGRRRADAHRREPRHPAGARRRPCRATAGAFSEDQTRLDPLWAPLACCPVLLR